MKKILVTRRLLRSCEDRAKEMFDANLKPNHVKITKPTKFIALDTKNKYIKFNNSHLSLTIDKKD